MDDRINREDDARRGKLEWVDPQITILPEGDPRRVPPAAPSEDDASKPNEG